MALFGSPKSSGLNPAIEACRIGSESSDRGTVAKAQDALLSALQPGESLGWVTPDIDGGSVIAATNMRVLEFYKSRLWASLPGRQIESTEIRQSQFFGNRSHSFKHSLKISWHGGPLRDEMKGGQYSNMFLWITRWEYAEIDHMAVTLRKQFGF